MSEAFMGDDLLFAVYGLFPPTNRRVFHVDLPAKTLLAGRDNSSDVVAAAGN
jgi:hypothetical protein